ncbi:MAG: clostripain-related cysteine peptidase [Vulcanimicrobiota bacterium]
MKISAPSFAVSGFFDGKAHSIQSQVLAGVDRLERASRTNQGDLVVRVDGRRSPPALEFAKTAAFVATGAAAGYTLANLIAQNLMAAQAGLLGIGLGSLLGIYIAAQAEDSLRQALKAPAWDGKQPVQLGSGPRPASHGQPSNKLKSLLQSNLRDFPSSRQVVCLAGHGNHQQVGQLTYDGISQALQGNPVEQVILDTCLGGQLEVLARLAPWSKFVLASPQPIPARGLPLEEMFSPAQLARSPRELAGSWVEQARPFTPSLAAWDCDQFRHSLLPALDQLGARLTSEMTGDGRSQVRKALARSKNPDRLPSGRVDLGSFLDNLQKSSLSPETLELAGRAQQAFQTSLVNRQNDKTLTFHLGRERDDPGLPSGWRQFLKAADYRIKPFF